MKIKRDDFLKFSKDYKALKNGHDNYIEDVKNDIYTKPLHAQKLYKDIIERLYNGYKIYENGEFEDVELELDYLCDYITFCLDYIYSLGHDYGLKSDTGITFYNLKFKDTYSNSFINKYEEMLLDTLKLIERADNLSNTFANFSKYKYLREKKKICYYELALVYTFYKEVDKGIEYYKLAYKYGSDYAAANLVYIFTRDDYLDCDLAVEYYNNFKQKHKHNLLNDKRLYVYYNQSTMNLIEAYKKSQQYNKILTLIKEFSKVGNIQIPNRENNGPFTRFYTESYLEAEEKIKELEEKKTKEEYINKFFKQDIIKKMSNDVKIYIETSLRVYDYVDKLNNDGITLDYSATLMPIMKGVEQLLKIVVKNYLKYLNECFDKGKLTTNAFRYIDKYLLTDDFTQLKTELADFLEIGTAYYVLFDRKRPIFDTQIQTPVSSELISHTPRDTFVDFCKCLEIENVKEKVIKLGEILFKVKNYRNNIAHDTRILKENADNCFKLMIHDYINLINELYTIFGDILK